MHSVSVNVDRTGDGGGTDGSVLDMVQRRLRALLRPQRPKPIRSTGFPRGFLIQADDRLLCDIGADRRKKRNIDNWIKAILRHGF